MEWNRGNSQGQPTGQALNHTAAPAPQGGKKQKRGLNGLRDLRLVQLLLLFSITILLVAVVWFVALGGGNKAEGTYVDDKKLQAVFLNGGQVYFGNINDLNGKFLSMSNIYYLRVNQQVQPDANASTSANDISLVKLGCELHGPDDNMVINREQVIFWENLKDDGQVAKAVRDYKTANPNGQKCDTATGTGTSTGTDTTTGTGTDTTKKNN